MTKTPDVATLIEMRDYHRARAQEYDRALALLASAQREAQRVRKLLGRVAARVVDEGALDVPPPRKRGRPRKHADAASARAARNAAARARRAGKRRGDRPIDRVRLLFAAHKGAPLTPDALVERVDLSALPAGQAPRVLGLVLARLVQSGELKETSAGYVARRGLVVPPSVNGASAS